MTPRNTRTGAVLEQMVIPALVQGGYTCASQVNIGQRISGGRHIVDVLATDPDGVKILVSLKWQQVSGTTEQKVPYEIISLADAISNSGGAYARAYVVLGGSGWKLREFYVSGGLNNYLHNVGDVHIQHFEDFIALANQGRL